MMITRPPLNRFGTPYRGAIERLLSDFPFAPGDGGLTELAPPIDVRETNDAYIVEVDVPGIDPGNIEILVEGRTLTIRGQMEDQREEERGNYLLRERRRGQFVRSVALPGMVEVDQVESRIENGLLTVTLPKAAQNRARRIEIRSASGNGSTANKARS